MNHDFGDSEESQQNEERGGSEPNPYALSSMRCAGRRSELAKPFQIFCSHLLTRLVEVTNFRGAFCHKCNAAERFNCFGYGFYDTKPQK